MPHTKKPPRLLTNIIFCVFMSPFVFLCVAALWPVDHAAQQQQDARELASFRRSLNGNPLIADVAVRDNLATIVVDNSWHVVTYQVRLQAAQNLHTIWESVNRDAPLRAMAIRDINGNEVGGTGIGGVWVQEQ